MTKGIIILFSILNLTSWLEAKNIDHPFYQIPDSLATAPDYTLIELTPYFREITDEIGSSAHLFEEYDSTFNDHKWYYLELQGNASEDQHYIVRVMNTNLGKSYLYEINQQNDTLLRKTGGLVPNHELDFIQGNGTYLNLSLARNEKKQLFIAIFQDPGAPYLEPIPFYCQLTKKEFFIRRENFRSTKSYILSGIFLSLFIYNLLLFITLRDRNYLIYLAFIFFWGVFATGEQWLPYLITFFFENRILYLLMNGGYLMTILFQTSFLRYREFHPELLKTSKLLAIIHILFFFPVLAEMAFTVDLIRNPYYELAIVTTGSVSLIVHFYHAWHLTKQGKIEAQYLMIANSIFTTAYIIAAVSHFGYVFKILLIFPSKYHQWEFYWLMVAIGLLAQAILFSLALGQKMVGLERDKATAVQDKLDTQQQINAQLEVKVEERTASLEKRNQENELLLGEVHHRVKNNLQIISSLLNLQSRQLNDDQAKSAVQEGRNRIKAMALVHQKLYQNKEFASIQMEEYISHLVDNLLQTHDLSQKDIKILLQIPAIRLDTDTAMSIGLILNELVSNALKHGLPGISNKKLEIHMKISDTELTLRIIDNGKGMPPNFKTEQADSFGLKLVRSLSQELDGDITFSNGPGTHVEVKVHDFSLVDS